jgi:hypothetical protein
MSSHALRELAGSAVPAIVCALLLAAGALLAWQADRALDHARSDLAAARTELAQGRVRAARIADEQREAKERLTVYRRLLEARVIGTERRLDWVDAIARIRARRGLLDLRYRIERQALLRSLTGGTSPVDFYASTLHVQLALAHEGDLLRFLGDLREAGNAFYAPQQCQIRRAAAADFRRGFVPLLHADCRIDLITIVDRAAKS